MSEKSDLYKKIRESVNKHGDTLDNAIAMLEDMLPEKVTDELRGDFPTFYYYQRLAASLVFLRATKSAMNDVDEKYGPYEEHSSKLDA